MLIRMREDFALEDNYHPDIVRACDAILVHYGAHAPPYTKWVHIRACVVIRDTTFTDDNNYRPCALTLRIDAPCWIDVCRYGVATHSLPFTRGNTARLLHTISLAEWYRTEFVPTEDAGIFLAPTWQDTGSRADSELMKDVRNSLRDIRVPISGLRIGGWLNGHEHACVRHHNRRFVRLANDTPALRDYHHESR